MKPLNLIVGKKYRVVSDGQGYRKPGDIGIAVQDNEDAVVLKFETLNLHYASRWSDPRHMWSTLTGVVAPVELTVNKLGNFPRKQEEVEL